MEELEEGEEYDQNILYGKNRVGGTPPLFHHVILETELGWKCLYSMSHLASHMLSFNVRGKHPHTGLDTCIASILLIKLMLPLSTLKLFLSKDHYPPKM